MTHLRILYFIFPSSNVPLISRFQPGPPHRWGIEVIFRHTTVGRTPLEEWSAPCKNLYQTTQNIHSAPPRVSNPQYQQASGCRATAQPPGSPLNLTIILHFIARFHIKSYFLLFVFDVTVTVGDHSSLHFYNRYGVKLMFTIIEFGSSELQWSLV